MKKRGMFKHPPFLYKTHRRYAAPPLRREADKLPPFLRGGRGDSSAIPKTHCRYVMLPLRVEADKLPPFLRGGVGVDFSAIPKTHRRYVMLPL